jgi:hypothetical protein
MKTAQSEITRALAAYWNERRGERPMPARRDIDPLTMPLATLPHAFMVDVAYAPEAPPRFFYRLIGTAINQMTGRDITGQEISPQTYGPHFETVIQPFRRTVETRRPMIAHLSTSVNGIPLITESLFLPLGGDIVEKVLGSIVRLVPHHAPVAKQDAAELDFEVRELILNGPDR